MIVDSHKAKIGFASVVVPMLIVLFFNLRWGGDPRRDLVDRFQKLRHSEWSWDIAEAERLKGEINLEARRNGVPVWIELASAEDDRHLLRWMLTRHVNVNSSDWGCTPLLAALDSDRGVRFRTSPFFAEILLEAGADPNLLPTKGSIDHRKSQGFPSEVCRTLDEHPQTSVLRMFASTLADSNVVSLLLDKGAHPLNPDDAQSILELAASGEEVNDRLAEVALKFGATLEGRDGETLLGRELRSASHYGYPKFRRIHSLIYLGADPNNASDGERPIEIVVGQCAPLQHVRELELEDHPLFSRVPFNAWQTADWEAQSRNEDRLEMLHVLVEAGADLRFTPKAGRPDLLTFAVQRCSSKEVEFLVRQGVPITQDAINASHFDLRKFLKTASAQ